jgi:hypothetical protein
MPDRTELLSWLIPFIHEWIAQGAEVTYDRFLDHANNFVRDVSDPADWHNFRDSVSNAARIVYLTAWVAELEANG